MGAFEELGFPRPGRRTGGTTSVAPIRADLVPSRATTASVADLAVLGAWTSAARSRAASSYSSTAATRRISLRGNVGDGVQIRRPARNARPRAPARPALSRPPGQRPRRPFAPSTPPSSMTAHSSPCPKDGLTEPIHLVFLSAPAPGHGQPPRGSWGGAKSQVTIHRELRRDSDAVYSPTPSPRSRRGRRRRGPLSLAARERPRLPLGTLCATQGRGTRFASHAISLGLAQPPDIRQVFAGRGRRVRAQSALPRRDRQHLDTTWVDHAQPHCRTRELYKRDRDDRRAALFVGRISCARRAKRMPSRPTRTSSSRAERWWTACPVEIWRRREVQAGSTTASSIRWPCSTCARAASVRTRRGPLQVRVRERRRPAIGVEELRAG